MTPPRVSVVVPAHNAAPTITAAIGSALEQASCAVEVIVVDDASGDATAAVVAALAARDARVRLVRNEANIGPAGARNAAIGLARGIWIALLDADDTFAPGRLERLVDHAEAEAADLVSDNLLLVDGPTGQALCPAWPASLLAAHAWLQPAAFIDRNRFDRRGIAFGYMKPVIRRDFLDRHKLRFDESLRIAEDYHLFLDCLLASARWRVLAEPLYRYAMWPGSTSRQLDRKTLQRLLAMSRERYGRREGLPREVVGALVRRERSIERFLVHVDAAAAFRAGNYRRMLAVLARRPDALPVFAEACRQGALKRLGLMPRHRLPV
jgi:succinoglycan biosynthesis protein ExoO